MYAHMDSTVLRVMEVVLGTGITLPPYISLTGSYHIEFIGGGRIYKKLSESSGCGKPSPETANGPGDYYIRWACS